MSVREESNIEGMEFIDTNCPYCSIEVNFLSALAGTVQGCPHCGQSLIVPPKLGDSAKKIPLPIEGLQLALRRFVLDDWEALLEYWPDTDDVHLRSWLQEQSTDTLTSEGQMIYLGIERKDDPILIGDITLQFTDITHLQARFQLNVNKILMTDVLLEEACSTLFVLCFSGLNIHRVVTYIPAEDNHLEQQLLSIGMRKEGNYRKDRYEDGEWRNTYLFAFLREEYQQRVHAS